VVSVVLPCLNEEQAIGDCIRLIQNTFTRAKIDGEIIVVDNGCTDKTAHIARKMGAKVVEEKEKGYGRAYQKGFSVAKGKYFVMGDADATYDFGLIPKFLEDLESGKRDFVTGSRYLKTLKTSGMPLLHRFFGNPMLTWILNQFFGCRYTDVYCGMRAFTKEAYKKIAPLSPGMEFNLELAINAHLAKLSISEVPIQLMPRKGESKLRTFRDGWRSLRMMLLYCPNKVFIAPGALLFALGLLVHCLVFLKWVQFDGRPIGTVSSLFATLFSVVGAQILSLGLHAKTYSWSRRFQNKNKFLEKFYQHFSFERGIGIGGCLVLTGLCGLGYHFFRWVQSDMHPLSNPEWISLFSTFTILGIMATFTTMFISAMSMSQHGNSKKN